MPILIDYNQLMLASIFADFDLKIDIDENMIRHMFLNSLRANRKKFKPEFGELVICFDNRYTWRKDYFPYYKANRKVSREESGIDWEKLHSIMNKVREELIDFFPYKTILIEKCEADDIIGTICHKYGTQLNTGGEDFLILSGDKDYVQLHKYANIKQYNPVLKKWIETSDPETFLIEHILKGDSGDGIPNILSADNCLVIGERQKPMTAKRIKEYTSTINDPELKRRYDRNKTLIDLSMIPIAIQEKILEAYNVEKQIGRNKLFDYFITNKLKLLTPFINDF